MSWKKRKHKPVIRRYSLRVPLFLFFLLQTQSTQIRRISLGRDAKCLTSFISCFCLLYFRKYETFSKGVSQGVPSHANPKDSLGPLGKGCLVQRTPPQRSQGILWRMPFPGNPLDWHWSGIDLWTCPICRTHSGMIILRKIESHARKDRI